MANKRNLVKKKSALARRRAGKINGSKGGYSGFRGNQKHPEKKSSSQSVNLYQQKPARRIKHTPENDYIDGSNTIDIIKFKEFYQSGDSQESKHSKSMKVLDPHCIHSSKCNEPTVKFKPSEEVSDDVESCRKIHKVFKASVDSSSTCLHAKYPLADKVG